MEKEKEKEKKEAKTTHKKTRQRGTPNLSLSAADKAQAVLAVWTERARPTDVCRQFAINPITFQQWQDRAMEGMLQALESRVNLSAGQCLSPRLQTLLAKRHRMGGAGKVEEKLAKLAAAGAVPEAMA